MDEYTVNAPPKKPRLSKNGKAIGRPRKPDEELKQKRYVPTPHGGKKAENQAVTFGANTGLVGYVQEGDTAKYLSMVMEVRTLPKINRNSIQEVTDRINEYFQICIRYDMKPMVVGLALSLGLSRQGLYMWKTGQLRGHQYMEIVTQAYDSLEMLWEAYMQNGKINPVSGIFLGKNHFGYRDQTEHVITPNTGLSETQNVDELRQRYLDEPDYTIE